MYLLNHPCLPYISFHKAFDLVDSLFSTSHVVLSSPRPSTIMPLTLSPLTPSETLSFIRIRSLAYYGPTHDVLHKGAIRESSIRGVAEDRKRELKKPHMWHWKIVDTELPPSADDPPKAGGRIIAIAAWSIVNVSKSGSKETQEDVTPPLNDEAPPFRPPELRLDAVASIFGPLRAAQASIMGTSDPYFMLNTLATHPDHQGRGAASMLLDWGLGKADREGLVTYLDATGVGKPVYEKRGFKVVRSIEWDREAWGGKGSDCHWCMVREPKRVSV
jgi:WD repeat-containing protein 48